VVFILISPFVGDGSRCAVVPIGILNPNVLLLASTTPVDAVIAKLLADDCNKGVVTEVVPITLGELSAPVDGL